MNGTWYPTLREQIEAEQSIIDPRACEAEELELDWEREIIDLATSDHVAYEVLREELAPFDVTSYDFVA